MQIVSFTGLCNQQMIMMMTGGLCASSISMPTLKPYLTNFTRSDFDGRGGYWSGYGNAKKNDTKKMKSSISIVSSSALAESNKISRVNFYKEILEAARDKFTREISFKSNDKDISLAKALLFVAAEDEEFLAFNHEIDVCSLHNEWGDTELPYDAQKWDTVDTMPMDGKNINEWLLELDEIAKEVEVELVSRDIGCHLSEVLESVNKVLFESRGFKRSPVVVDPKLSYLHSALSSGCASGIFSSIFAQIIVRDTYNITPHPSILLSVIYIEVCRRLNLTIVGSRVGNEFLIWPPTGNPEELFKVTSGNSLFRVVNGKCVDDPRSKASDINSNSLLGLDIASNRDIIGIALANLIRLYWKRASRTNHGLMLTSPLRSVHNSDNNFNKDCGLETPILRPQELSLAIMASERLLILQPHNWVLRRDYGMMLYYNRAYEVAVQELSVCMAFAPEEEFKVLEPFVKKLHLLRLENSWKSSGQKGQFTVF